MMKKFTEWLDEDDSVVWTRMLTSKNETDRRIAREFLSASCAHVCGVAQKDPCFEGDPYKVFKKHPSKRVQDMAKNSPYDTFR